MKIVALFFITVGLVACGTERVGTSSSLSSADVGYNLKETSSNHNVRSHLLFYPNDQPVWDSSCVYPEWGRRCVLYAPDGKVLAGGVGASLGTIALEYDDYGQSVIRSDFGIFAKSKNGRTSLKIIRPNYDPREIMRDHSNIFYSDGLRMYGRDPLPGNIYALHPNGNIAWQNDQLTTIDGVSTDNLMLSQPLGRNGSLNLELTKTSSGVRARSNMSFYIEAQIGLGYSAKLYLHNDTLLNGFFYRSRFLVYVTDPNGSFVAHYVSDGDADLKLFSSVKVVSGPDEIVEGDCGEFSVEAKDIYGNASPAGVPGDPWKIHAVTSEGGVFSDAACSQLNNYVVDGKIYIKPPRLGLSGNREGWVTPNFGSPSYFPYFKFRVIKE